MRQEDSFLARENEYRCLALRMKFRPFAEARDYVHKLELKGQKEWRQYCKSGKKPADIPSNPRKLYKNSGRGWATD